MAQIKAKWIGIYPRYQRDPRSIIRWFGWLGADDAFPVEAGELEIEEQGKLQTGDGKIAGHLGSMGVSESGGDLRIDDDEIVHNQFGSQGADELAIVMNGKGFLLLDVVPEIPQLDDKGVFVEFFVQSGPKRVEHFHCRANNS